MSISWTERKSGKLNLAKFQESNLERTSKNTSFLFFNKAYTLRANRIHEDRLEQSFSYKLVPRLCDKCR